MALILPYIDRFAESAGCYITEDGEFILTNGSHARYTTQRFLGEPLFLQYFESFGNELESIPKFAVQIHNWDRLRTIFNQKTIESSSSIPNIRFYNWILMGFKVDFVEPLIYNSQEQSFKRRPIDSSLFTLNEEYGKRIEDVKRKVLLPDRRNYFLDKAV